MYLPLLAIFYALVQLESASAGPIQRDANVVRRADTPAKRFIALSDPISFNLLHARATGSTAATSTTSSAATDTNPGSDGNENGKVPAVGVGAGNTSLLALLSSTTSPTSVENSAQTTNPVSANSTSIQADAQTGSQNGAVASQEPSQQVGKVPAVGVGSGNTSLLALLSSAIASATPTPATDAANGEPSAEAIAEDASAILPTPASSTPCSSTGSTSAAADPASIFPVPAAEPSEAPASVELPSTTDNALPASGTPVEASSSPSEAVGSNASLSINPDSAANVPATPTIEVTESPTPVGETTAPENTPEESSTVVVTVTASNPLDQSSPIGPIDTGITAVPLPVAASAAQSTVIVSIPTTVSVRQAQGGDSPEQQSADPALETATTFEPTPRADVSIESTSTLSGPETERSSIGPGETVTLPLSPTSVTSQAAIAGLPTTKGATDLEASPPSETVSEPTPAEPLASTTVTPLANTPDVGAESTPVTPTASPTPTPIPAVSVLQPEAETEATSSIATPTNERGSDGDMTITIGDLSIVIRTGSGSATTAAGNSVIPVLGSSPTTVTVTTTVTAA